MSRESRKSQRKSRQSPEPKVVESLLNRDPLTRWKGLSSRGGHPLSFVSVGNKIPVDLDDPTATFALSLSTMKEVES
jgi:hypothetical protein